MTSFPCCSDSESEPRSLVSGYNLGREFKSVSTDGVLEFRSPRPKESVELLNSVVDSTKEGKGLDNITLNSVMCHLARVHKAAGDEKQGKDTLDDMLDFFRKKNLKQHVLSTIEEQAGTALE